jgi:pimeloyl-ACP methyl ester carboxylesterase
MDTPVQYATTADGVRVAFSISGEGTALVHMPPIPLRHLQWEGQFADDRRWLERIGRRRMLVRYDPRGLGLSDRDVGTPSLEALVTDLEAVVDRVPAERVALFAALTTGPLAVAYAVRHPERVSHLMLWCASARGADAIAPQLATLAELAERDWDLFTEAAANVMRGWAGGDETRRYAMYLRACMTASSARALIELARRTDVTELLPLVRSPTLVLHRREITWIDVERSRELASRIPTAQLRILEGTLIPPALGDTEAAARALDEFIGDQPPEPMTIAAAASAATTAVPENAFAREGEYWTLSFDGVLCRVRDTKGLHHIAHLLRYPGQHVAAGELLAEQSLVGGGGQDAQRPRAEGRAADLGDAGPVLDRTARLEYTRRLEEMRAELEEAERFGDRGREEKARAEIDFVTSELAAAFGLRGRERRAASSAERARLTVTKRIKDALKKIRACHPTLGEHLGATIKTGYFCVYSAAPDAPVAWSL